MSDMGLAMGTFPSGLDPTSHSEAQARTAGMSVTSYQDREGET